MIVRGCLWLFVVVRGCSWFFRAQKIISENACSFAGRVRVLEKIFLAQVRSCSEGLGISCRCVGFPVFICDTRYQCRYIHGYTCVGLLEVDVLGLQYVCHT